MPEEWHPQPAPPSIGSFLAMAYPAPYGPAERASLLRQLCRRAADQSADDPPEPHTPARQPLSPHFPGGGKGPPLPTVIPHRCTAVVLPRKSGQRRGLPPSFTGTGVKCRRLRRIYGPGGGWIIPAPRRAPATAGDPAGASLPPLPPTFWTPARLFLGAPRSAAGLDFSPGALHVPSPFFLHMIRSPTGGRPPLEALSSPPFGGSGVCGRFSGGGSRFPGTARRITLAGTDFRSEKPCMSLSTKGIIIVI